MKSADSLLTEVEATYQPMALGFTGPQYWLALRLTYQRTIADVLSLAAEVQRLPGRGNRPVSVLEIGAFAGLVSTALRRAGMAVTAADIPLFMRDERLLKHYADEGVAAVECDLSQLPTPLASEAFDIVVCCEVLEHLNFNALPVFHELNRLLRPGGFLYLATPNQANVVKRLSLARGRSIHDPIERLAWQLDPNSSFSIGLHWREFTAQELVELFAMSGFTAHRHYYCHYVDRQRSSWLRSRLVDLMYSAFPAFLPGQVAIAAKSGNVPPR